MIKTMKIDASGMSVEQRKRVTDSFTKATIRVSDEDFSIEGALPISVMLAISCRLLDMACVIDGEGFLKAFKEAWNHNNCGVDRLRLYTEKDIRDIRTTMETLQMAFDARQEGRV